MNYYSNNAIGKSCQCCGGFYPTNDTTPDGHEIIFDTNKLGFCDKCFGDLIMIIKNKQKEGLK